MFSKPRVFQAFLALAIATGIAGRAVADHFDNQTKEERPTKKKKPLTKYEKSEYISKTSASGEHYYYTEDGDIIDKNAKAKKSKHKSAHKAAHKSSSGNQPKKAFKHMSMDSGGNSPGHSDMQRKPLDQPQAAQTSVSGATGGVSSNGSSGMQTMP